LIRQQKEAINKELAAIANQKLKEQLDQQTDEKDEAPEKSPTSNCRRMMTRARIRRESTAAQREMPGAVGSFGTCGVEYVTPEGAAGPDPTCAA
jgi:hypothetical protein